MDAENKSWIECDSKCYFLIFVVTCVLIAVALKFLAYSRKVCESAPVDSNPMAIFGQCRFPDCIRCRRHIEVMMRARTKLTYCDDTCEENSVSVATLLLKDIQASHRKLAQGLAMDSSWSIDVAAQNSLVFHIRGIRAQPVWNSDEFAGLEILPDNLEEIQNEFWKLRQGEDYADYWKENDTLSGKWSICHLLDQGIQTAAVTACPATWRIISRLPDAMTDNLFGNVAFSVLEPGTAIAPHFGPSNIRIRCHLGLQVPNTCQLTVGTKSLQWSEGKVLCFDETFLHSVQFCGSKDSVGERIILIIDLWHPDLNTGQRNLINYAFSPAIIS